MGKVKLGPILKKLQNLPDSAFQGPLIKYKRDYRAMVKRIRRGESGLLEEAQDYGTPVAEEYVAGKVTEEDMAKIKETITKITKFVVKVAGTIAKVIAAVKSYKAIKEVLTAISELSEKANLITASSMVGPAGGPFALIAWLQRQAVGMAVSASFAAGGVLRWVEKKEAGLVKFASGIVDNFAQAIKHYFGAKAAKAVRAEKWGTALHDDVVRTQKEADDAKDYADDQVNRFKVDVFDAFDDAIMDEFDDIEIDEFDEDLYEDGEFAEESIEETTDTTYEDPNQTMAGNYPFSAANFYSTEAFGSHANAVDARTTLALASGYETWDAYKAAVPLADRKLFWDSHPTVW